MRLCRKCHAKGCKAWLRVARYHSPTKAEACEHCGERRKDGRQRNLVDCHQYDFREATHG